MKGSDNFKKVIQAHIKERCAEDSILKAKVASKDKNINDCIQYVLNTVKKSGRQGFTDDEVFGMAVHYYDEENIDIGKKMGPGSVVVNHKLSAPPKKTATTKATPPKKATPPQPTMKVIVNKKTQQTALF